MNWNIHKTILKVVAFYLATFSILGGAMWAGNALRAWDPDVAAWTGYGLVAVASYAFVYALVALFDAHD